MSTSRLTIVLKPVAQPNVSISRAGVQSVRVASDQAIRVKTNIGVPGPAGQPGVQGIPGRDGVVQIDQYAFEPSLVWRVEHNKGTRRFFEQLTDAEGWRFIAPVRVIDENTFEVYLSEAIGGTVDVVFNGGTE